MSEESLPEFLRYVIQVKIDGFGSLKYQFRMSMNPELMDEPGLFERAVYYRAARIAKDNRASGQWPNTGSVMVWYAHLDADDNKVSEKEWHEIDAKYQEQSK